MICVQVQCGEDGAVNRGRHNNTISTNYKYYEMQLN